ncbi:sensor histidine kinase [Lysobacter niabensis]|uniref:sensor histidine kinase n=1 Tax=Agrilutibacter niabensis TaxID=380628 RepID=UPI003616C597
MSSESTPPRTTHRRGLRRGILLALLGYVVLLSVVVIAQGFLVHERAERLVWRTMLNSELDHTLERMRLDPGYRWSDTSNMRLYDGRDSALPPELDTLGVGLHDDVVIGDRINVVMVRGVEGHPLMLALDITDFEQREVHTALNVVGVALALIVVLGLLVAWAANRLVRPLSRMAEHIVRLRPDLPGQHVEVPPSASSELHVIADALNDYLRRNDSFVERERTFIDTASHELRTPVAVISGAAELALQHGLPPAAHNHVSRIRRTSRDVEELISLLLVLAKDPAGLSRSNERVALDQLLPEIIEDHRHLTHDKALTITLAPLPQCGINAPLPIVQAAIGNLLRNAIEHSDRGDISVRLEAPATVVIDDPGHGMTPEEISAIYARIARGGGDRGGGIGLDLISRLCEHLGWRLEITSGKGSGTTTTLTFPT